MFGEDIETNLSPITSDFIVKRKNSKIEDKFSISWNEILWNIFLVIIATVGSLYAYFSVIDFKAVNYVIVIGIFVFSIFSCLQICLSGRVESIFITFVTFDILLFFERNVVMNGLCSFIDEFVLKFNDYYGDALPMLELDDYSVRDNTIFLLFAIFIIIYIISIVIIFRRTWVLSILLFLPVFMCLTVGYVPDRKFLMLIFICIIINIIVNVGHRKRDNICVKLKGKIIKSYNLIGLATVCITIILTVLISNLLLPRMDNVFKDTNDALRNIKNNSFLSNLEVRNLPEHLPAFLENIISNSDFNYTGVSGGRLGRGKDIFNKGQVDLSLQFEQKLANACYFKSYVGTVYKNTRWDTVDDDIAEAYLSWNHEESAFNLPYNILESLKKQSGSFSGSFTKNSVYVNMKGANNNYLYWPYLGEKGEQEEVQLSYLRPDGNNDYFNFYYTENIINAATSVGAYVTKYDIDKGIRTDSVTNKTWINTTYDGYDYQVLDNTTPYLELEEEYRQKVYTVCLQVPNKGMDRLKKLIDEEFVNKNGERNINDINLLEKIVFVQDYLKDVAVYDVSPGTTPISEDFVDYFLFENKKGYCMHFASAASLMFRILGVPSRFVEGYVVHATEANTKVEVKDQSAHAWAEIYIDGFGWIPIETTPGYNQETINREDIQNLVLDKDEIESTASDETEEESESESLNETESDDEKENKNDNNSTDKQDYVNNENKSSIFYDVMNSKWMKATINIIKFIIFIILVRFAIIERRKLVLKLRKQKFNTENNKKTVRIIYNTINKIMKSVNGNDIDLLNVKKMVELCPYLNEEEYSEFIGIVNKTLFSKHNIDILERKQVEQIYKQIVTNIYFSLTKPNQFIFKYIYCYI